ncbi:hypothetical protein ACN3XK_72765, partial [Actinomadura welshii]
MGASAGKPKRNAEDEETAAPIVTKVPDRYRALVLLGTFASLRWGELAGLRRKHLDLDAGVVRVVSSVAEMDGGKLLEDTPKSRAGRAWCRSLPRSSRTCKRTWMSSPRTVRTAGSSSALGVGLSGARTFGASGTRSGLTSTSLTSTPSPPTRR